jgi:hypothetical protein
VRSYWDGEYFLGKTQTAGFLAFIPSAFSSFRSEWNWGVVTTSIVGLDPLVNPGLRAGMFGEMYFNFGLIGVAVAGLVYGYVIRLTHNTMRSAVVQSPFPDARLKVLAGMVTASLMGSLLNTAGFFGFYITVAILGGLHTLEYILRAIRHGGTEVLASQRLHDASST